MAQSFPETYRPGEGYKDEHERIFGSKSKPCGWCEDSGLETGTSDRCRRGCDLSKEIQDDAEAHGLVPAVWFKDYLKREQLVSQNPKVLILHKKVIEDGVKAGIITEKDGRYFGGGAEIFENKPLLVSGFHDIIDDPGTKITFPVFKPINEAP